MKSWQAQHFARKAIASGITSGSTATRLSPGEAMRADDDFSLNLIPGEGGAAATLEAAEALYRELFDGKNPEADEIQATLEKPPLERFPKGNIPGR